MKKVILAILVLALTISSFAQQKNYGTKTIGQWTFEKFPTHYSVLPTKKMSYKNQITGKLEQYEEFNQLGQTNGLKLTMSSDGINPSDAIYMYKGVMVYSVTFFPSSKTAQQISNYNEQGALDGYTIYRTLKSTGGYTEEVEKYVDDVLVELNGVKQAPFTISFKDSLLDGKFRFVNSSNEIIEGEAEKGKLKKIKQTQSEKYLMVEIVFLTDSIKVKTPNNYGGGYTFETFPLISNPIITNSKFNCMKYGNYNGYPYLFVTNDFDASYLTTLVRQHYLEKFETEVVFKDSLLDGQFQYRQYVYTGGFPYSAVIDVKGEAEMGKLLYIITRTIELDAMAGTVTSNKSVQYDIQDNIIRQRDFVPELPDEPVSSTTFKMEYPVLLTNSKILGGVFKLRDTSWDFSIDNMKNIFGTPYNRKARLEGNKYGYVYFSPFTFDISNYLEIVKTKTEKPVENKTTFNNGFLDGDFDFKEDRIQFNGNASAGIIESLNIKCDFITSKDIIAPGTEWNGKTIYYDVVEMKINAEAYNVSYILSKTNQKTYEEVIPFAKNKKITSSENLSGYQNFAFIRTYQDLRSALFEMKFIDKK